MPFAGLSFNGTVLRVVLALAAPLAIWGRWNEACASELRGVEARRVLDRIERTIEAFASHGWCSGVRRCRWRHP